MPQATQAQLQNFIALGYVSQEGIAAFPLSVVLTRLHWVFVSDEDYSTDLDAWIEYADAQFPGLDVEALDMAIGCC